MSRARSVKPRMTQSLVIPFILSSASLSSPLVASEIDELNQLLEATSRALEGRKADPAPSEAAPKADGSRGTRRKKARSEGEEQTSRTPQGEAAQKKDAEATRLKALDLAALSRSLETKLTPPSEALAGPAPSLTLAGGLRRLGPSYVLHDEEDRFQIENHSSLVGASLAASFPLGEGVWRGQTLRYFATAGLAYYQADLNVERRGIQNETTRLGYQMMPARLGTALTHDLWGLAISWGYGLAFELVGQTGRGQLDTTNGWFGGDYLEMGLSHGIGADIDLTFVIRKDGGLLVRPEQATSGESIALGMTKAFRG